MSALWTHFSLLPTLVASNRVFGLSNAWLPNATIVMRTSRDPFPLLIDFDDDFLSPFSSFFISSPIGGVGNNDGNNDGASNFSLVRTWEKVYLHWRKTPQQGGQHSHPHHTLS